MNWEIWGKFTFYWVSLILLLPFLAHYLKTIKNDRSLFWVFYEDGERKFDYAFLKKLIVQLFVIYFAFFTFMNVIYFVFNEKWISDTSFHTARGFVIIGSVIYIIELIEKSDSILHEQKQKKIRIAQKHTKRIPKSQ